MNRSLVLSSFSLVVSLSLAGFLVLKRSPSLGVVDTQRMMGEQAKILAKDYPKGNVPKPKLHALIDGIRDDIQAFGKEHGVTLFAKGSLLSGEVTDYTDHILRTLNPHDRNPHQGGNPHGGGNDD
jgi:hypothetical protein